MNDDSRVVKQRIIQELVPGKQISLAHIIASPDEGLYEKVGLPAESFQRKEAIGVMTVSPAETAIIIADVATKAAGVTLGFVDRENGSLIITGSVSEVESAMIAVLQYADSMLDFSVCPMTKT